MMWKHGLSRSRVVSLTSYPSYRRQISFDIPSLQEYAYKAMSSPNNKDSYTTYNVYNPATGETIGKLPSARKADVVRLGRIAMTTWQSTWKHTTGRERSALIKKMVTLIETHKTEIAKLVTLESGKPLSEALGELAYATSFYELYAEEAKRVNGDIITSPMKGQRLLALRQPVGPAALITPWNFPAAMITRKLGPALAAGCTTIVKPSEETPFTALAICALAEEAGIPPGVVNILTCGRDHVSEVGLALCHNEDIRKLSFTGSTNVGKWLMRESATTMKKVSLELGGSAPFIVFEDADLDVAVRALMTSKFRNAGQACIASNRILVHRDIYNEFAKLLTEKVKSLKVGYGFDADSSVGPLINSKGLEKVSQHVNDSVAKGATAVTGGSAHEEFNSKGGSFYVPTVLTGVTKDMLPFQEETFGPIAPLLSFSTEEEAINIANDTRYGLAGYICTRDLARAWRVSEALEFGMIGVNEGGISHSVAPFGGIKESGIGREGGPYGLDEYLEYKYVCMGLGQ